MSSQQVKKNVMLRNFFEKYNNFFTNKFLFKSTNIKDIIIYFLKNIIKSVEVIIILPDIVFLNSAIRRAVLFEADSSKIR